MNSSMSANLVNTSNMPISDAGSHFFVLNQEACLLAVLFLLGAPLNLYCFILLHCNGLRRRRNSAAAAAAVAAENSKATAGGQESKLLLLASRASAKVGGRFPQYSAKAALLQQHLNVADLLISVYFAQIELWRHLLDSRWYADEYTCRITKVANSIAFHASSLIVSIIAFDRAVHLKVPQAQQTVRMIRMLLWAAWVVAVLLSLPQAFIWNTYTLPTNLTRCMSQRQITAISFLRQNVNMSFEEAFSLSTTNFEKFYDIIHMLSIFWIPFVVIICCYCSVLMVTMLISRRMQTPDKSHDPRVARKPSRKRHGSKVLRKGTIIVMLYLLCWFPYNLVAIWSVISPESYYYAKVRGVQFLYYLIILNSVLNPFVYHIMPNIPSLKGLFKQASVQLLLPAANETKTATTTVTANKLNDGLNKNYKMIRRFNSGISSFAITDNSPDVSQHGQVSKTNSAEVGENHLELTTRKYSDALCRTENGLLSV